MLFSCSLQSRRLLEPATILPVAALPHEFAAILAALFLLLFPFSATSLSNSYLLNRSQEPTQIFPVNNILLARILRLITPKIRSTLCNILGFEHLPAFKVIEAMRTLGYDSG